MWSKAVIFGLVGYQALRGSSGVVRYEVPRVQTVMSFDKSLEVCSLDVQFSVCVDRQTKIFLFTRFQQGLSLRPIV